MLAWTQWFCVKLTAAGLCLVIIFTWCHIFMESPHLQGKTRLSFAASQLILSIHLAQIPDSLGLMFQQEATKHWLLSNLLLVHSPNRTYDSLLQLNLWVLWTAGIVYLALKIRFCYICHVDALTYGHKLVCSQQKNKTADKSGLWLKEHISALSPLP